MIANKEKCADKNGSVCDYNEYRRLRYFHGMLLDDKDFQAEQNYHTKKRRFLNRMLHGRGVVCGLELKGKKGGRSIEVTSGFALDCAGNEIWVPHEKPIDLTSLLPAKDKGNKEGECIEEEKGKPNTYYVGVRYEEKPSDPVSVYLPSGSCEERTCENSRFKEGYCIELVPCCEEPDAEQYPGLINGLCGCKEDFTGPQEKDLPICPECNQFQGKELCQCLVMESFCEQSVPCPECCSCEKPCFVVLGKIEVNKECRLESICINKCRRYVLTPHLLEHMLLGVFGTKVNSDGYFQVQGSDGKKIADLPEDVGEWIYNPIKALCWLLPLMVNGGHLAWLECDKRRADQPTPAMQVVELRRKVDALTALDLPKLKRDVNELITRPRGGGPGVVAAVDTSTAQAAATEGQAAAEPTQETPVAEKPNGKQKTSKK